MGDEVIRTLLTKIDRIAEDVATIKARIEDHAEKIADHEKRLRKIEMWKASQEGIAGFVQRWGPVAISTIIAIYVTTRHG